MSALLLDTHVYVWAVTAPDQLSERARNAIVDPRNALLVSAASVWEMAIKHHAGKWPEAEILLRQHESLSARLGAGPLPITAADAVLAGALSWEHADPFDRMIASQALLSRATLVTRDRAFLDFPGLLTLW